MNGILVVPPQHTAPGVREKINNKEQMSDNAILDRQRCAMLNSTETVLNNQLKSVEIMVAQRVITVWCAAQGLRCQMVTSIFF